jgi:hypothetical protein
MALEIFFREDVTRMLASPVAAMWPKLSAAERELAAHLLRCQLLEFGVSLPPGQGDVLEMVGKEVER